MGFRFCKQLIAGIEKTSSLRPPLQLCGNRATKNMYPVRGLAKTSGTAKWGGVIAVCACTVICHAQSTQTEPFPTNQTQQEMQERIQRLEREVRELKTVVQQLQSASPDTSQQPSSDVAVETKAAPQQQNLVQPEDRKTLDALRNTTINLGL